MEQLRGFDRFKSQLALMQDIVGGVTGTPKSQNIIDWYMVVFNHSRSGVVMLVSVCMSCPSVCMYMSVCNMITFKSLDIESSFLVCWAVLT